jgi:adenylyltransferase/sulfurtransferase
VERRKAVILLRESVTAGIRKHAEAEYPWECCGVLIGVAENGEKRVTELFPISNARNEEHRRNRFLILPEETLRAMRYARDRRLEILGYYHSHPDHPAEPSAYDLEHAWPVCSYIIISAADGIAGDITSWILADDRSTFIREPVKEVDMSTQVRIAVPSALRSYTQGLAEIEVRADNVRQALDELTTRYPELRRHLFTEKDELRSFVNVFVHEENIRQKEGLDTRLAEGDMLLLIPAIAGGSAEALPELSREEMGLYSRHLILPEVGLEGQKRLKAAKVLLVGTGGLGSPLGLYLAAAGTGTLGIVDYDVVEESNLQRQIIHGTASLGRPKTESAAERILGINPHIPVRTFNTRLSSANVLELFGDFDIIVDGTDNFPTRYLINDACALLGKPNVYGSVFRFEGQVSVFDARKGCCLRCLFPEPPDPALVPSCGEGGVLGVLPGIVGCIQANEVIKLIVGGGRTLINRLLAFDAWTMRFHEFRLEKNPDCALCGRRPTIRELADYEEFCGLKKASGEEDEPVDILTPLELRGLLDKGADIQIIDVRLPQELSIGVLPGAKSIPLAQLFRRMDELDPARDAVLVCKKGENSETAVYGLREAGYEGRLFNLAGGMNAWAKDVDRSMPVY